MAFFDWDDRFSVKVDSIDTEHKRLLALINDTHEAIVTGKKQNALADIFNGLIDYTREHFSHEEELHARYEYPDRLKHKIEHTELTQKVVDQYREFVKGKNINLMDVLAFLVDWLQDHILRSDMKFGAFLEQQGKK